MEKIKALRFEVEGFVNSFRISQTAVYQLTHLVPTKTNIVGMLTNISGKTEKDYYSMLRSVKVGIVPINIDSLFVDLWRFKKLKTGNRGVGVLKREKLHLPKYLIYIVTNKGRNEEFLDCLKFPKRIPSLGMDDELIEIKNPVEIEMEKITNEEESKKVDSIFVYDPKNKIKYTSIADNFWAPRFTSMNLNFENEIPRRPKDIVQIVEFCGLKFELDIPIEVYLDKDKDKSIQFI